ncbi:hypothetical protein [Nocardia yamanashiensis]|uniref:hypothetical protein n=1 Tax=Nocardia yamanashiensis TaxID=209247 RepID=UPI000A02B619|nr:hypothetical protein [Nocardia yamanashiensis]
MGDNPCFHQMPDHPVLNLAVAQHALDRHRDCPDDCEVKRYFTKLVPYLQRGSTTWNIWAPRTGDHPDPETRRREQ